MNAAVKAALETDLANLFAWDGSTFTWDGLTIPCSTARLSEGGRLQIGGEWVEYAGRVICARTSFTGDIPRAGNFIRVNGNEYRIERVVGEGSHPIVTLHLSHGENPLIG